MDHDFFISMECRCATIIILLTVCAQYGCASWKISTVVSVSVEEIHGSVVADESLQIFLQLFFSRGSVLYTFEKSKSIINFTRCFVSALSRDGCNLILTSKSDFWVSIFSYLESISCPQQKCQFFHWLFPKTRNNVPRWRWVLGRHSEDLKIKNEDLTHVFTATVLPKGEKKRKKLKLLDFNTTRTLSTTYFIRFALAFVTFVFTEPLTFVIASTPSVSYMNCSFILFSASAVLYDFCPRILKGRDWLLLIVIR